MFRRTVILPIVIAGLAATALFGQGLRNNRNRGFAENRIERLGQRLNLTDTQMNAVRALADNRQKEIETFRQDLFQKRQTLRRMMREANPNPSDIGNATLALRDSREQRRSINQRFVSGVKALLTPEQLQKFPGRR